MSQVTKPILLDETGQAINATLRGIYGKMSGTDISDGDVEAGDMLLGKIGYNADGRVVGTIPSKAAATITPSTSDQTIAAGQYLSGAQTIKGDADLVAANIKKDVQIFGVTGTFEGGTDISDTTATAADVLSPKKFHAADGTLKTGTIATKTSANVTASGATVTVPAGYYAAQVQKSVTSGTAGTPTATKGAVSNHSVTITPKVTNATGYITGGEKTGTAVTVTASELVSGTKTITANGSNIDISNYEFVTVAVPIPTLPTLNAPEIILQGSQITIFYQTGHYNGSFVEKYKIYSGSTLVAEVDPPQSNKLDLSTIITSPGTHTVTIKASGSGFNDSAASNSVEYTVASVSTVDVTCSTYADTAEPNANCYFKFGSAPTSASDYDFVFGNDTSDSTLAYLTDKATGTTESIGDGDSWTKTYTTTDVYVWGETENQFFTASFNDTIIDHDGWGNSDISRAWTNPAHLTVDSNSTLNIECTVFQGSWD